MSDSIYHVLEVWRAVSDLQTNDKPVRPVDVQSQLKSDGTDLGLKEVIWLLDFLEGNGIVDRTGEGQYVVAEPIR